MHFEYALSLLDTGANKLDNYFGGYFADWLFVFHRLNGIFAPADGSDDFDPEVHQTTA